MAPAHPGAANPVTLPPVPPGTAGALVGLANGVAIGVLAYDPQSKDGNNLGVYALPLAPVPLPPSLVLFGTALLGFMVVGRRQLLV